MKPVLYILRKSLKNHVKALKTNPLALIGYILVLLCIALMAVMSAIMPARGFTGGTEESFGALVSAALIIFLYFGIKQGVSHGNSFFRLADVNLLFTAPVSPRRVMIYGFIQQFFLTFFIMLFMSFQIPNLKLHFPIKSYGIFIIYAGVFLMFFTMQLIGMLIYSIASKSLRVRSLIEKALNVLLVALALGFLAVIIKTKDVITAAVIILGNDNINYIPFFGWFRALFIAAVTGITQSFYINLVLASLTFAAMAFIIYKLKADYYEDVLAATERKEKTYAAKREGNVNLDMAFTNGKLRKIDQKYHGTGAKAIFFRHLLEFRKSGRFFINRVSLFMIIAGIVSKYLFHSTSLKTVLYFTVYMLFFFSIKGKWVLEIGKPFIYLIPDSSRSKVIYATLAETLKNAVDGLLLFTAAGLMFKADVLTVVLCAITYTTYGTVYTYGDLLSRRILGEVHSKNLQVFGKMFMTFFIMIPGIAISMGIVYIFNGVTLIEYYSYLVLIAYNLTACLIILLLTKGIFEQLEIK